MTGNPVAVDVTIPPLDSLTTTPRTSGHLTNAKLHGGLLDGLREYYAR